MATKIETSVEPVDVRTPKEASFIVRLSVRTLQEYRVTGRGPEFIKVGTKVLYPLDALNKWLSGQPRYKSTSDAGYPTTG